MKKQITLNLDQATFEYLEVLAYGLNQEHNENNKDNPELMAGFNNEKNDFAPLVSTLLEKIAGSLADGVRNPSSWERNTVESLTGWDGTVNRGMFGETVDIPEPEETPAPEL